jgi:general stress protein YciG
MAEKSLRGFAAMDRAKQKMIASKGGKAAHLKGTAHEFTPEEARAAGRKGGQAAHAKGTAHEFTSEEARAAGRKGGQSSHSGSPIPNGNPELMSTSNPSSNLGSEIIDQNPNSHVNFHQPEVIPPL